MNKPKILSTLMMVSVLFVGMIFTSPGASAGRTYTDNWRGSRSALRYAPTTLANAKSWIRDGSTFRMKCWVDHQYFVGNYGSRRWFYGQTYDGGYNGFVHSSYVHNQTRVPHCSSYF